MTRSDQPAEQLGAGPTLPRLLAGRRPSSRDAAALGHTRQSRPAARQQKAFRRLDIDMPAQLGFAALARAPLERLAEAEGIAAADLTPDLVHECRVAARRLRALLAAFSPSLDGDAVSFLRGELAWAQHSLAPARDWDVFLQGCLAPFANRRRNQPGARLLLDAANRAREQAYQGIEAALSQPRYRRLILKFRLWLDAFDGRSAGTAPTVGSVLTAALQSRYRKIAKADRHDERSEEELHRLRLRVKKLRDLVDFARSFYAGRRLSRFAKRLGVLQNELGALQDAAVARDLIGALAADAPAAAQEAARTVADRQAAFIAKQRGGCAEAWAALVELKRFWRRSS
jgi:CHAD domain-containing protein